MLLGTIGGVGIKQRTSGGGGGGGGSGGSGGGSGGCGGGSGGCRALVRSSSSLDGGTEAVSFIAATAATTCIGV